MTLITIELYAFVSILFIIDNMEKYEVNGKARKWTLGILAFALTALSTFIGTFFTVNLTSIVILILAPGLEQELMEGTLGLALKTHPILQLPAAILSIIYIPKLVFRTASRNKLRTIPEPDATVTTNTGIPRG